MEKDIRFAPKRNTEEVIELSERLFEITGRLKAFEAYLNSCSYSLDREICAAMLGIELEKNKKISDAKND